MFIYVLLKNAVIQIAHCLKRSLLLPAPHPSGYTLYRLCADRLCFTRAAVVVFQFCAEFLRPITRDAAALKLGSETRPQTPGLSRFPFERIGTRHDVYLSAATHNPNRRPVPRQPSLRSRHTDPSITAGPVNGHAQFDDILSHPIDITNTIHAITGHGIVIDDGDKPAFEAQHEFPA